VQEKSDPDQILCFFTLSVFPEGNSYEFIVYKDSFNVDISNAFDDANLSNAEMYEDSDSNVETLNLPNNLAFGDYKIFAKVFNGGLTDTLETSFSFFENAENIFNIEDFSIDPDWYTLGTGSPTGDVLTINAETNHSGIEYNIRIIDDVAMGMLSGSDEEKAEEAFGLADSYVVFDETFNGGNENFISEGFTEDELKTELLTSHPSGGDFHAFLRATKTGLDPIYSNFDFDIASSGEAGGNPVAAASMSLVNDHIIYMDGESMNITMRLDQFDSNYDGNINYKIRVFDKEYYEGQYGVGGALEDNPEFAFNPDIEQNYIGPELTGAVDIDYYEADIGIVKPWGEIDEFLSDVGYVPRVELTDYVVVVALNGDDGAAGDAVLVSGEFEVEEAAAPVLGQMQIMANLPSELNTLAFMGDTPFNVNSDDSFSVSVGADVKSFYKMIIVDREDSCEGQNYVDDYYYYYYSNNYYSDYNERYEPLLNNADIANTTYTNSTITAASLRGTTQHKFDSLGFAVPHVIPVKACVQARREASSQISYVSVDFNLSAPKLELDFFQIKVDNNLIINQDSNSNNNSINVFDNENFVVTAAAIEREEDINLKIKIYSDKDLISMPEEAFISDIVPFYTISNSGALVEDEVPMTTIRRKMSKYDDGLIRSLGLTAYIKVSSAGAPDVYDSFDFELLAPEIEHDVEFNNFYNEVNHIGEDITIYAYASNSLYSNINDSLETLLVKYNDKLNIKININKKFLKIGAWLYIGTPTFQVTNDCSTKFWAADGNEDNILQTDFSLFHLDFTQIKDESSYLGMDKLYINYRIDVDGLKTCRSEPFNVFWNPINVFSYTENDNNFSIYLTNVKDELPYYAGYVNTYLFANNIVNNNNYTFTYDSLNFLSLHAMNPLPSDFPDGNKTFIYIYEYNDGRYCDFMFSVYPLTFNGFNCKNGISDLFY